MIIEGIVFSGSPPNRTRLLTPLIMRTPSEAKGKTQRLFAGKERRTALNGGNCCF